MNFEARFDILRNAGMLSPETERIAREIITYFITEHGIELSEENAAAFITHACAALERVRKGEAVEQLDDEVYAGAQTEPTFPKARQIADELGRRYPQLPEAELRFFAIHIGALSAQAS